MLAWPFASRLAAKLPMLCLSVTRPGGALIARSEPPPPNSVSSTFSPPPPHRAAINIAAIGGFALYPPPSLSLRLPLRSLPLALSLSWLIFCLMAFLAPISSAPLGPSPTVSASLPVPWLHFFPASLWWADHYLDHIPTHMNTSDFRLTQDAALAGL